ncbi:alpha/beta hydrolase [Sphingobium yanoikuyae]|uniref:Alpha/beta hydrolase n=1 Tax=Sphingobium yanoikuyae TaxID=13690 RepID=A0AA42WU38_SPHYA|nr:alpha/beta hydrolase [Sphingobium yanoikuyae]MDH2130232.1 alpha/beta hydrolase [Sphingobium yanoikuyae]MDH2148023.1 alpha/beta hydrolase [Sphingobium yanoikuyae]MDH2165619.1 alpha/beta hydrolase [Sphingobium yanoikuyae]
MLAADLVWPLRDAPSGAFALEDANAAPEQAVVTAVDRPVLLGYAPDKPNGRAMLVLGGGGYVALMAGREGVQVARWLTSLGYHAFVLIHRFPHAGTGPSAPLDDALVAMRMIRASDLAPDGVGVVGLSSGGHLAACLAAHYPADWGDVASQRPDVLVIGYAPISTNAKGRTIVADKPPLPPVEKQALYDALQPDAQLLPGPPPAFIVYAGNDPVVPVENAHRLGRAWQDAGGSAELHIFADAPHGFALDTPDQPVSLWPRLCEAWLKQVGFL